MKLRIALVAPTRSDPAHRRILSSLRARLVQAGDEVLIFPPRDGLSPAESRRKLESLLRVRGIHLCHIQSFNRGLAYLDRAIFPPAMKLVLTHHSAAVGLMEHRDNFQRLADRADAVTTVSRQGLRELLTVFPDLKTKSLCIPNGADTPTDARMPATPKRPFILATSRLAAYKGIDVLLMAFSALAARHERLDLVLCGPDQTAGRLKRFARVLGLEGRVRFLGDTKPPALGSLLAQSLFFVLPSRKENMPLALLEALAAGKAVVAANAGGVSEILQNRKNGLLVAPQNVPALERALDLLVRDASLRRRLGRRAAIGARAFSWARVTDQYRGLYANVVGARANDRIAP